MSAGEQSDSSIREPAATTPGAAGVADQCRAPHAAEGDSTVAAADRRPSTESPAGDLAESTVRQSPSTEPPDGDCRRELILIGIGAGNPEWVTLEAIGAIRTIDVLFVVLKEDQLDDLVEARRVIIERHRDTPLKTVELRDPPRPWQTTPDYPAAVAKWRAQRLESWSSAVAAELPGGASGGFLIWGDPSLYESTLAIVQKLADASGKAGRPIDLRVIPGISCVLALAAAFKIPLNRQGRSVEISPARLLAAGMPEDTDDVVVMLDGKQTFSKIDPAGIDIYWGAYLGAENEILISGPLDEVRDEILRVRKAAAEANGWIFDTYLLRRV